MLPGKYLGIISTPSSITKSNNCTMMCVRSFICSPHSSKYTKVKKKRIERHIYLWHKDQAQGSSGAKYDEDGNDDK